MQYTLLIYADPTAGPSPGSPEFQERHDAWMSYTQAMIDAGVHIAGEALQPTQAATTVRQRDGETLTVDGPFAETKEILGGFYILDTPNLDDALTWAGRAPHLGEGSVEVRPVMTFA
jgi:hypothetical protein